jgi:hypothetical protein
MKGYPIQIGLCLIWRSSVQKPPIKKETSHRDRKERKGTDNHGSKGYSSRSVFACLAIFCAKTSDQKGNFTQRSQRTQRKGQPWIEGLHPDGRCLFGDLLCKNLRQKGNSAQRSQRTQSDGRPRIGRLANPIQILLCDLRDLCVKIPFTRDDPRRETQGKEMVTGSKGDQIKPIFATFAMSV